MDQTFLHSCFNGVCRRLNHQTCKLSVSTAGLNKLNKNANAYSYTLIVVIKKYLAFKKPKCKWLGFN